VSIVVMNMVTVSMLEILVLPSSHHIVHQGRLHERSELWIGRRFDSCLSVEQYIYLIHCKATTATV